jgi:hypothetical protein
MPTGLNLHTQWRVWSPELGRYTTASTPIELQLRAERVLGYDRAREVVRAAAAQPLPPAPPQLFRPPSQRSKRPRELSRSAIVQQALHAAIDEVTRG